MGPYAVGATDTYLALRNLPIYMLYHDYKHIDITPGRRNWGSTTVKPGLLFSDPGTSTPTLGQHLKLLKRTENHNGYL